MTLPRSPNGLVLPGDLVGHDRDWNGKLPASLLTDIVGPSVMHHTAARAWKALVAAAPFVLTYTGTSGVYRTFAVQVALFLSRYQTTPIVGASTKTWNGVVYYQKPGTASAATPGTSNHGLGLAVDTAIDFYDSRAKEITPQMPWMLAHAPAYGFWWESDAEPWHITYSTGDTIPAAVLAFENPTPPPPVQEDDVTIFIRGNGPGPGAAVYPFAANPNAVWALTEGGALRHVTGTEKAVRQAAAKLQGGAPYVELVWDQAQVDAFPKLASTFEGGLDEAVTGINSALTAVSILLTTANTGIATANTGITATRADIAGVAAAVDNIKGEGTISGTVVFT